MSTENELYKLEEKLWTGNADDYRRHVDDECLTVFTEMAGVLPGEDRAIGRRWPKVVGPLDRAQGLPGARRRLCHGEL